MKKEELKNKALKLSKDKIVFYLVESGSRLWGFESKDSDYDLRGFFVYKRNKEFSLKKADYFEYLNKSEKFDLVLFHVDKAFNLLSKSNPSVIEWLMAKEEDIYFDKFNLREWFNNEIKDFINLRALFCHYFNLARDNWQKYFVNNNKLTYKKTLYILRGLLNAKYILEKNELPPIKFLELIKIGDYKEKIEKIIEIKKKGKENMVFNDKELLNYIKNLFDELKDKGKEINYEKEKEQRLFKKVNKKVVEIKDILLCQNF
ncbi:MAG: nucleotidyltransferase domain-containing protein [Nanoarchaeota archaeon]